MSLEAPYLEQCMSPPYGSIHSFGVYLADEAGYSSLDYRYSAPFHVDLRVVSSCV